jgi:hypothetical protein
MCVYTFDDIYIYIYTRVCVLQAAAPESEDYHAIIPYANDYGGWKAVKMMLATFIVYVIELSLHNHILDFSKCSRCQTTRKKVIINNAHVKI